MPPFSSLHFFISRLCLVVISYVTTHVGPLSYLLGLLYLDIYRHGRDPLTNHASTSNINLEEQEVTNEVSNPKNKSHRGHLAV